MSSPCDVTSGFVGENKTTRQTDFCGGVYFDVGAFLACYVTTDFEYNNCEGSQLGKSVKAISAN